MMAMHRSWEVLPDPRTKHNCGGIGFIYFDGSVTHAAALKLPVSSQLRADASQAGCRPSLPTAIEAFVCAQG